MLLAQTRRLNFGRCYAAGAQFLKDVPLTRRDGEAVKVDDLKNKVCNSSIKVCPNCVLR